MKYHNRKVVIDGKKFDSEKEGKRYLQLKILERAKIIKDLELQKKFILQPSYINKNNEKIREISYIADFYYYDNEKHLFIVEDTKGYRTEVYKLKKKLFEYVYPDLIIEER